MILFLQIHNLMLWAAAAVLCILPIYGPFDAITGGHVISLSEADFYNAFSRTSWSIGLSLVIISCSLGQGGNSDADYPIPYL